MAADQEPSTPVTWVDDDDFDDDDDQEIGADHSKKNNKNNAKDARRNAQHQQNLDVAKQLKSLTEKIESTNPLEKPGMSEIESQEESKGHRQDDDSRKYGCKWNLVNFVEWKDDERYGNKRQDRPWEDRKRKGGRRDYGEGKPYGDKP
jgi:hypothetical protein